ncbi:uncharacterized protein LOC133818729 isoform X2 [Humulus lupulus]|uniref:uncharacterized protein LOC133818729 isoform X2 n=1 Tax=Humulus lupulus TaxID=3486 RepID=UPI002B403AE6|nr:uncharacterized protein LOC133818729 isoform X2 [Humulus lupulus]
MIMKHKAWKMMLIITIISFSYLLTLSSATPTSRLGRLMENSYKGKSLFHEYLKPTQPTHEVLKVEVNMEIEEEFIEGRMDFEKNDYSGVGANPEHDPKPPAGNV